MVRKILRVWACVRYSRFLRKEHGQQNASYAGVLVETFTLICAGGLRGQAIGIEGLQKTITDVLVQLHDADDNIVHIRMTPEQPLQTFTSGWSLQLSVVGD